MSTNRLFPPGRIAAKGGRFALLCLVWPVLVVLRHATAGPLPLPSLRSHGGNEELHLMGLLPLEGLLPSLKDRSLQETFMEAFPKDWALPKFSPSSAGEISELHSWLSKVKQRVDFDQLRKNLDPLSASPVKEKPSVMQTVLDALLQSSLGDGSALGGAHLLLSGADVHNALPTLLNEFTASLPLQGLPAVEDVVQSNSGNKLDETFVRKVQLFQRLPSLDQLNIGKLAEIFAVPSDIEWPVEQRKVSLLLPMLTSAENGGLLGSPRTALVEKNGVTSVATEVEKILIPVAQPDGQLLFAKLQEIFPYMRLPQTLTVLPLATLKNTELATLTALWSGLKSILLPRQAIMSADSATTLVGPVLSLANLSKLILASCETLRNQFLSHLLPSSKTAESTQSVAKKSGDDSGSKDLLKAFAEALGAGFPLEESVKNVFTELSTKLQEALLPFEGIFALDGTIPSSRFHSLDQWKASWNRLSPLEFRDDLFFRLKLPVLAVSRETFPSTFRLLQRMPGECSGTTGDKSCALGLAPTPLLTQEALEDSVAALSRRVEILSEQLKAAVHQLQERVAELVAAREGFTTTSEVEDSPVVRHASSGNLYTPAMAPSSSPSTFKEPEGLLAEGGLFELPDRLSLRRKNSYDTFSALQQALEASVKLCDTLTVALRFTKNEVKNLHLSNRRARSSSRSKMQDSSVADGFQSYAEESDIWESPDNAFPNARASTNTDEGSDLRRSPFLANLNGRALVALPRHLLEDLLEKAQNEAKTVDRELHSSAVHLKEQELLHETKPMASGKKSKQERRLQASQESGALAAKELALVDPLTIGKVLFAHVDGASLLEALKKTVADAIQTVPGVRSSGTDARDSTAEISLPPLLEKALASNALAFPAFTFPAADLLRANIFPTLFLQAPVKEWVTPTVHLPSEAASRTLLELLQLQLPISQLKSLSVADLFNAGSTIPASAFGITSETLQQKLGELHLKSLLPPQLLELPLKQVLRLPAPHISGLDDLPDDVLSLPLGKLLAIDEATTSLLSQPLGDVLGLKDVLTHLTPNNTKLFPTAPKKELSNGNSQHSLSKQFKDGAMGKVPGMAGDSLTAFGVGDTAQQLPGETDLLDLSVQTWLAPGSSKTSATSQKLAEDSFLQGKKDPSQRTHDKKSRSLANFSEGLRTQRPMTDVFRHLWNVAGVTFANELFF